MEKTCPTIRGRSFFCRRTTNAPPAGDAFCTFHNPERKITVWKIGKSLYPMYCWGFLHFLCPASALWIYCCRFCAVLFNPCSILFPPWQQPFMVLAHIGLFFMPVFSFFPDFLLRFHICPDIVFRISSTTCLREKIKTFIWKPRGRFFTHFF